MVEYSSSYCSLGFPIFKGSIDNFYCCFDNNFLIIIQPILLNLNHHEE